MKYIRLELVIPMLLLESERNRAVSDREAIGPNNQPNKTGYKMG